jgi:hypothetical protein
VGSHDNLATVGLVADDGVDAGGMDLLLGLVLAAAEDLNYEGVVALVQSEIGGALERAREGALGGQESGGQGGKGMHCGGESMICLRNE